MKLQINPRWKYITKDSCDTEYLYSEKPAEGAIRFRVHNGSTIESPFLPILKDIPWRESLHEILPDGTLRKPLPDLKIDDKVLVWNFSQPCPVPRHFAGWKSGKITCWYSGRTSHTSELICTWDNWKLLEEDDN